MRRERNWLFTIFQELNIEGETNNDCVGEYFYEWMPTIEKIKFCVAQYERCPRTARGHWQGYIEFENGIKQSTAIRRITPRTGSHPHVEKRNGSRDQAIEYCSKDDSRLWGPWYYPKGSEGSSSQGKRNDLDTAIATLEESGWDSLIQDHAATFIRYHRGFYSYREEVQRIRVPQWRTLCVYVVWGHPGCGKTRRVYESEQSLYRLCIPTGNAEWWDGYGGERAVLIDDFYGQLPLTRLLNILDGYPLRLPMKGRHGWAMFEIVWITSNVHWEEWYEAAFEKHPLLKGALQRRITHVDHMITYNTIMP